MKFSTVFRPRKGSCAGSTDTRKLSGHNFIAKGNGRLFLAIYQEKIIGGLICLIFGQKCLAMHMGALYQYQKLQTYYAYVWESIRWAKEMNCSWYSFRGVGTTPTQESFKRKFQPQAVALAGYYDLPLNPLLYRMSYWCEFDVLPRIWRKLMNCQENIQRLTKDQAHGNIIQQTGRRGIKHVDGSAIHPLK